MESEFDFRDLFVLDLANNHQGSVEHGKKIIQSVSDVCNKHGVRAAVKFQFRQLDTFIDVPEDVLEESRQKLERGFDAVPAIADAARTFC